jgi:hypothetical protein
VARDYTNRQLLGYNRQLVGFAPRVAGCTAIRVDPGNWLSEPGRRAMTKASPWRRPDGGRKDEPVHDSVA